MFNFKIPLIEPCTINYWIHLVKCDKPKLFYLVKCYLQSQQLHNKPAYSISQNLNHAYFFLLKPVLIDQQVSYCKCIRSEFECVGCKKSSSK